MPSLPLPDSWDRAGLSERGFVGFVRMSEIRKPRVVTMPSGRGLYVVLREASAERELSAVSSAKGVPYSIAELEQRWVPGCHVLYIGKTDGKRGLHQRIKQYARRGNSHQGGRAIWQVEGSDDQVLAWIETSDEVARDVERDWITGFVREFGKRPFANKRD